MPGEALEKEREIQRARAVLEGKPAAVIDRIVEGRMAKFYEEVCLLEQPFVKEATLTIGQLVKTKIAKLGENITVSRFIRYQSGRRGGGRIRRRRAASRRQCRSTSASC